MNTPELKPFLVTLNIHRKQMTQQQYRTIKGQILAGETEAAMKGLHRLMRKRISA